MFYLEEKFRSTSKEDALFYCEEKELITCRSLKLRNKL